MKPIPVVDIAAYCYDLFDIMSRNNIRARPAWIEKPEQVYPNYACVYNEDSGASDSYWCINAEAAIGVVMAIECAAVREVGCWVYPSANNHPASVAIMHNARHADGSPMGPIDYKAFALYAMASAHGCPISWDDAMQGICNASKVPAACPKGWDHVGGDDDDSVDCLMAGLIAAGFAIEHDDKSLVWNIRIATHRQMVGMFFMQLGPAADFRRALQIGPNEGHAHPAPMAFLRDYSRKCDDSDPVWILAPGAKYVAQGNGAQLKAFIAAEEARVEAAKAAAAP